MPAPPDGSTAGFVTMSNPTDKDVTATLTVVPSEGSPAKREVALAAHTTTSVNVAEVVAAPFAAAQVDVQGGGVVVEQSVAKGKLRDPSACATATASTWYVANGVTTRDATLTYFVYNPYPDDTIVDMDFATNEGRFAPQPLQGLVVRGGTVKVINVTDQVRRRTEVAGTVTARSGRVVLGRLQTYDGSGGPNGFTSGVAAPSPAEGVVVPRRPPRAQRLRARGRLQPRPELGRSRHRGAASEQLERRRPRASRRCSRSASRPSRRPPTTSRVTQPSRTAYTASWCRPRTTHRSSSNE